MSYFAIFIAAEESVASTIGAVIAALVPMAIVVIVMVWLDRWAPKPWWLLVVAFLWGAGIASICALGLNSFSSKVLQSVDIGPTPFQSFGIVATIVAPLVEESLKALGVIIIMLARRRAVKSPLDGVVIGGILAAGFAFTENVLYFARFYEELPLVFFMRAMLGPFGHTVYTSIFGLALGMALTRIPSVKNQGYSHGFRVGFGGLFTRCLEWFSDLFCDLVCGFLRVFLGDHVHHLASDQLGGFGAAAKRH